MRISGIYMSPPEVHRMTDDKQPKVDTTVAWEFKPAQPISWNDEVAGPGEYGSWDNMGGSSYAPPKPWIVMAWDGVTELGEYVPKPGERIIWNGVTMDEAFADQPMDTPKKGGT